MFNFLMDPDATINGGRPGGWENPPIGGDLQRIICPISKELRDWGIIGPIIPIHVGVED